MTVLQSCMPWLTVSARHLEEQTECTQYAAHVICSARHFLITFINTQVILPMSSADSSPMIYLPLRCHDDYSTLINLNYTPHHSSGPRQFLLLTYLVACGCFYDLGRFLSTCSSNWLLPQACQQYNICHTVTDNMIRFYNKLQSLHFSFSTCHG